MKLIDLLFPILKCFKEEPTELEIIANNNLELAKELEEKSLLSMSAQEIKQYLLNQNK